MNQYDLSRLRALFAVFLETARKQKGIERGEVALRMRTTEEVISEWESGERKIDSVELLAFCQAIRYSPEKCAKFIEAAFDLLVDENGTRTG